jgi:hypothetical protein
MKKGESIFRNIEEYVSKSSSFGVNYGPECLLKSIFHSKMWQSLHMYLRLSFFYYRLVETPPEQYKTSATDQSTCSHDTRR